MPNAVITGASQGIGKAIAEKLIGHGFTVVVCARSKENLHKAAEEWLLQQPDAKIVVVSADLSTEAGVAQLSEVVKKTLPTVDILVNNAGTYQPGTLREEPEGILEGMIATNLYSAYRLTRKLLPMMEAAKCGHIFNMCSVASLKAYPNGGSYSISKYALLGFSDNLREELREHNIKVTSICPGATYSPSWENSGVSPERIMEVNDIADVLWNAYSLSRQALVETIVMRPALGDL